MPRTPGYERIGEHSHQILDLHVDDQYCHLYGYTSTKFHSFLYHLFAVIFIGLPYVLGLWYPCFKTLKYRKCDLKTAKLILVIDTHKNFELLTIKTENVKLPNEHLLRHFYYRHTKFVWITQDQAFGPLDLLIPYQSVDSYLNNTDGLYYNDYIDLLKLYDPNKIDVEVKSYCRLFFDEVFNPFYIFQLFSISLWCLDHYFIYACVVFILTVFSIATALRQTKQQSQALHDLVESSRCENVKVIRRNLLSENVPQDCDPSELVPGDLVVLPKSDFVMPCDAVLLTGQCIVNESTLTGESVPVVKTSLPSSSETYCPTNHKRHTLFAGTHMIQSRYYGGEPVLARVVLTGFNTTKGALVKSILYPTPVSLQLYKDSFKFILALFVLAMGGMGYSLFMFMHRKVTVEKIILRTLDIVTIVVPPALPAAMTVGMVYSQNRLEKLKIFCIGLGKINLCGKVKLACFDKTGTLTQDGLDLHSVIPSIDAKFVEPIRDASVIDRLVQAMATCHSLTQIDGKLTGDPLDMSMFEFTKWYLEEPGEDETTRYDMLAPTIVRPFRNVEIIGDSNEFPYQIGIIRQFPFSSTLQCMSVICREIKAQNMIAFAKGAPEKISTICQPDTLPNDFFVKLTAFAAQGYRVIAVAYKEMAPKFKWKEAQRAKRDLIERDLTFLGLLVMQNTLKPETAPVLRLLHKANIRTVMITGDNILTAVSVARDCEMVKPHERIFILDTREESSSSQPVLFLRNTCANLTDFHSFDESTYMAIDGKTWTKVKSFFPDLLPELLVKTTVFARFQPDQKAQLVADFQKLDYVVSMVGDGANDCAALKAAHVGVSLSQAEASVAAPFTSAIPNISCIIHLIMEGRCALVTSFAVFKYMALCSLIQFSSTLILYRQHSILSDMQYLFIDLVLTFPLVLTIGRQGPSDKLGQIRPPGSLVSLTILLPIFLQVLLCVAVQIGALYFLQSQSWFEPIPDHTKEVILCWENTVIFTISSFQYLILAFMYSKGRPYRQALIHNFWFVVSFLSLMCFQVWLLMAPNEWISSFFKLMYLPHRAREQMNFRYYLLLVPLAHFFCALCIEVLVADALWFKRLVQWVRRKKLPKNRYKMVLQESDFSLNLRL